MIEYRDSATDIDADQLNGFFVGWPNPPSLAVHLQLLQKSSEIVLAIDTDSGNVVGFITAITDQTLAAYIPLLEVLPAYQKQQIGKTLVEKMLTKLRRFYMIDLLCDAELQPYYEQFGMRRASGMLVRNYDRQSGIDSGTTDE